MFITLRKADFHADAAATMQIDTSFQTDEIYTVIEEDNGLRLVPERLPTRLVKRFPLDDLGDQGRPYDQGWLAFSEDQAVGFAATSWILGFQDWCSGTSMWIPRPGDKGVGRRLVQAVIKLRSGAEGAASVA